MNTTDIKTTAALLLIAVPYIECVAQDIRPDSIAMQADTLAEVTVVADRVRHRVGATSIS